ncbi:MAG TPA: hypothetical protein DCM87_10870 [Planctomycetes bacterium]|nr:hypothetical protein [Planctomycetota bacterium]
MKHVGWATGVLCASLAFGAEGPWPHPPPQDDDPFCVRQGDMEYLRRAFGELLARPSTAERLAGGASIARCAVRSAQSDGIARWTADFYFALGAAAEPEHVRYALTRVVRTQDRATGGVTWRAVEAEDLVLAVQTAPPPPVACTQDGLRAAGAVLDDQNVGLIAGALLPYYALKSVTTPPDASFASGQAVPVTLVFAGEKNRDDRVTVVIDVTLAAAGAPAVKCRLPVEEGGVR